MVGLHTVFEYHEVMTPNALEVFLDEYRISFPVGIDTPGPSGGAIPLSMCAYGMQGKPTLVMIDGQGRRRALHFDGHDELALGAKKNWASALRTSSTAKLIDWNFEVSSTDCSVNPE